MTRFYRTGFTLVELLVVISIIAMLAGLLLPAIQGARENGRRITCVSNQSQVAFALLNYEHTRGSFPALRRPLKGFSREYLSATDPTELTWVSYLLPFMEQNTAWDQISKGAVQNVVYELVLPIMRCVSSGISPSDNRINYVVNAGPQNVQAILGGTAHTTETDYYLTTGATLAWDSNGDGQINASDATFTLTKAEYNPYFLGNNTTTYPGSDGKPENNKFYGIFFDHFAGIETDDNVSTKICDTTTTVEFISGQDGTSMTILMSENIDAGHWIWKNQDTGYPIAYTIQQTAGTTHSFFGQAATVYPTNENIDYIEDLVSFCYPTKITGTGTGTFFTSIGSEIQEYEPVTIDTTTGTDIKMTPLFINEGRPQSGVTVTHQYRKARPASGHPGVVVAAFADRHTQYLRDDMDRALFVQLCRPSSGRVLNPKDL